MSDLAGFLAARLDEDEAAAKAATPGPWRGVTSAELEAIRSSAADRDDEDEDDRPWTRPTMSEDESRGDGDVVHIARHDPARVLREVAVQREILERYEEARDRNRELSDGTAHDGRDPDEVVRDEDMEALLEDMIGLLASVYSDHPDYDPAWAVS